MSLENMHWKRLSHMFLTIYGVRRKQEQKKKQQKTPRRRLTSN